MALASLTPIRAQFTMPGEARPTICRMVLPQSAGLKKGDTPQSVLETGSRAAAVPIMTLLLRGLHSSLLMVMRHQARASWPTRYCSCL